MCVVSTSDETTDCGFILLLTKTCTRHQGGGGSLGQKLHFLRQFSPWKLEFCWVNISESRLTVKNLFTWGQNIVPPLDKNVINFSLGLPWRPLFIVIYNSGKRFLTRLKNRHFEHILFLLALRFISKLKQEVNMSPFVNHFKLKNSRALDNFCMPIKWKCIPDTK